MPAGLERRPRLRLRRGGRGEAAVKPIGDGRMKQRYWVHGTGQKMASGKDHRQGRSLEADHLGLPAYPH
jgi:hypothetical protein